MWNFGNMRNSNGKMVRFTSLFMLILPLTFESWNNIYYLTMSMATGRCSLCAHTPNLCIPYENKKGKERERKWNILQSLHEVTSVKSIGNANNNLHYCEMNVERKRKILCTAWKSIHTHARTRTNMHRTNEQNGKRKTWKQVRKQQKGMW